MNVRPPCVVCRVPLDCPCLREGDRRPKMCTCALQPTGVYPQSRLFSAGDGSPGAYLVHMCGLRCDQLLRFCDPVLSMMKGLGKVIHLCDSPFCEREGTKKCARCRSAFYCSKNCQRLNWRQHKRGCIEPPPESFREWVYTNIRERVTINERLEAEKALETALGRNRQAAAIK